MQIKIQADEKVPLSHIKKVMNALISEGWTGINFAVQSKCRISFECTTRFPQSVPVEVA
jgi:hypothetical protein